MLWHLRSQFVETHATKHVHQSRRLLWVSGHLRRGPRRQVLIADELLDPLWAHREAIRGHDGSSPRFKPNATRLVIQSITTSFAWNCGSTPGGMHGVQEVGQERRPESTARSHAAAARTPHTHIRPAKLPRQPPPQPSLRVSRARPKPGRLPCLTAAAGHEQCIDIESATTSGVLAC